MRPRTRVAAVVVGLLAALAGSAGAGTPAQPHSPRVVQGTDRYLYIAQDWTVACQDRGGAGRVARDVAALARTLRHSGRDLVVVLGPDKSSVVRSALPAQVTDGHCGSASRDALWSALDAVPAFLDLRPALRRAALSQQTYWRDDTHWTPTSGAVYGRALAQRLDPPLAARLTTVPVTYRREGDLARVLGLRRTEVVRGLRLVNPGVRVRELPRPDVGLGPARLTRAVPGPGGRVLPGRTVFVGDSFDDVAVEQLAPLCQEALFFWPGLHDSDLAALARQLAGADRVVVESVERFGQRFRAFDPEVLPALTGLPPRV